MRGRPRKGKSVKTRISSTIAPELLKSFEKFVKKSQLSRSEVLECLIKNQLEYFNQKGAGAFPSPISQRRLEELCNKRNIKTLRLYGSALTNKFKPFLSDIDLLVKFAETPGMFEMSSIQEELKKIFTYEKIDLRSEGELSPKILESVKKGARVLYEQ